MLCECGCGQEIAEGRRYRSGHNTRGKPSPATGKHFTIRPDCSKKLNGLSEEHKRNIGLSGVGRKCSELNKMKLRERMSGSNNPMYGRTGSLNPFFGKHHSQETIDEIRFNDDRNRKIGISGTGIHKPGKENAIKGASKIAESKRSVWKDPIKREALLKSILIGNRAKPNVPENMLGELLSIACPDEYVYTGDGSIIVCGLAPDFTNVTGKKKVIEMFGDYWHRGQNPHDRIDRFTRLGYDCLVLWEHEIKKTPSQELIEVIRNFNNHDAGRMTRDAGRVTGDGCLDNEKAPGTSAEGLSVGGLAEAKPLPTNAIVPDGYPVVNR